MTKSAEQKARQEIVEGALKWIGFGNGTGYPGKSPNPACEFMHLGTTYSCACGVSMNFGDAGYPLVSMQQGYPTGYTYCPSGAAAAKNKKAVIPSWETQPADILFIDTSHEHPGHTEMVVARRGAWVYSIGWDSGPSNVESLRLYGKSYGGGGTGQGGTHLHKWYCPAGKGNPVIFAAADAAKLADLRAKSTVPSHAPTPSQKDEHSQVVKTTLVPKRVAEAKDLTQALEDRKHAPTKKTAGLFRRLIAAARKAVDKGKAK